MSLIRKHGAVLQAWACLALVTLYGTILYIGLMAVSGVCTIYNQQTPNCQNILVSRGRMHNITT